MGTIRIYTNSCTEIKGIIGSLWCIFRKGATMILKPLNDIYVPVGHIGNGVILEEEMDKLIEAAAIEIERLDDPDAWDSKERDVALRAFNDAAMEFMEAIENTRESVVTLRKAVDSAIDTVQSVTVSRREALGELDEVLDLACANMVRLRVQDDQ